MPILETALIIGGIKSLIAHHAGTAVVSKIAGYAATHTVAATMATVAPALAVAGAITWTADRIDAFEKLQKAIKERKPRSIVFNAYKVSGILSLVGGIEGVDDTLDILNQVLEAKGKNLKLNAKAATRCGSILSEVYKLVA